ncbi:MAG: hypothetical protein ACRC3H_08185 [Lachnospiraceae bacterium]
MYIGICSEKGKRIDPYDIADMERDIEWDLERITKMRQRNAENYRKAEMQEEENAGIEF